MEIDAQAAVADSPPEPTTDRRRPAVSRNLGWTVGVTLGALVIALPVIVVFAHVFLPADEVWSHLAETVLADYVLNSLLLMLGVAAGTLVGGVGTAWLASMCSFPGRAVFEWALLLPMALPAYIIAYTYTGLLDFAGPLQTAPARRHRVELRRLLVPRDPLARRRGGE